jgi:hypothetical protein
MLPFCIAVLSGRIANPRGTLRLSGTPGEYLFCWCIVFVAEDKWNAKYLGG